MFKLFKSHGHKCVHAKKGIAKILGWLFVVSLISGGIITNTTGSRTTYQLSFIRPATAQQSGPSWEDKIREQQDKVLATLATCETGQVKEQDAAIIFDSNAQASIGRYQFQIQTVQLYVKKFEGREITRLDAIQIALDQEQASDLARKIIFEDDGKAINNWYNCNQKHGLKSRVEIINDLSK